MERVERIGLGDGCVLLRSTQGDYDRINADLRAADRAEADVFGRCDRLSDMESSWTVVVDGDMLGYIALMTMPGEGVLSTKRFIAELTTNAVWRHRKKYVRHSRDALRAVVERAPSWVRSFFSMPMKAYAGSVRWQERVLGFDRLAAPSVNGIEHVLFGTTREKVMSW